MGVELPEIGAQMMKFAIFSVRACYRSVSNHPFLFSLLCFLGLLYRSSPFLFSALLSISPVIVCTAILLGTLLSFGHPSISEGEIEEKKTVHDIPVPLKSRVSFDAVALEKDVGDFAVHSGGEPSRGDDMYEFGRGSGFGDGEVLGYSPIPNMGDNNLEFDIDKSVDSFDSKAVYIGSGPGSPWNQEGDKEEEEDDDDDSSEDESLESSPRALMDNILPMLDELHPLLDEDSSRPVNRDDFSDGIVNQEEVEDGDDESENDEEDEEGDEEESNKSVISWTKEDEKNLMDLGSSELERNQRLERLIARRIAQKNMGTTPIKRNLIDLEGVVDLPFNVAPISTARKNPFDIHDDDQNDRNSLPPIPGSAPSVLHPRRNPFDVSYDAGEEKADLMEGCYEKEFMGFQPKELLFARHQSFKVQPSLFRQNEHDRSLRPFFVSQRMGPEGESHTSFQRQLIDLSDNKVSFIPEIESAGLFSPLEGHNPNERNLEDQNIIIDQFISQDPDLMSRAENVYDRVEFASNFSEVEQLEGGRNGKKDNFGAGIEFKHDNKKTHHSENPSLINENVADMLDFSARETNSSSAFFIHSHNSKMLSDLQDISEHTKEVISKEPLLERSDVNPHKEATHNSSPISLQNHISSSPNSFAERGSVERSLEINNSILISEEMLGTSPNSQPVNQNMYSVFDPNTDIKACHGAAMESVSRSSEDICVDSSENNGTSSSTNSLTSEDHKEGQESPLILLEPDQKADFGQSDGSSSSDVKDKNEESVKSDASTSSSSESSSSDSDSE
ncbi:unnamed protein product [Cuscuta campestris]|uniref:Uncharacterized protein n=1 Tax=Cuscuta campestris TaxID=132261 RepID=A0A484L7T4_9ASTE|nr:unnamed protein product [Cuscuta campestris]